MVEPISASRSEIISSSSVSNIGPHVACTSRSSSSSSSEESSSPTSSIMETRRKQRQQRRRRKRHYFYVLILVGCILMNFIGIHWIIIHKHHNQNQDDERIIMSSIADVLISNITTDVVSKGASMTTTTSSLQHSTSLRGKYQQHHQQQQKGQEIISKTTTISDTNTRPINHNIGYNNSSNKNNENQIPKKETTIIRRNETTRRKKNKIQSNAILNAKKNRILTTATSSEPFTKINKQNYLKFNSKYGPLMMTTPLQRHRNSGVFRNNDDVGGGRRNNNNVAEILPAEVFIPPPSSSQTQKIRVRVLLFELYNNRSLTFRRDGDSPTTSHISDEVLNICLDGLEKSPYFDVLSHKYIPNNPNFYLMEENTNDLFIVGGGTNNANNNNNPPPPPLIWMIDMRRSFHLKQVVSLVEQTLKFHRQKLLQLLQQSQLMNDTTTILKLIKPNLKLVFVDYTDKPHLTLCQLNDLVKLWDMLGGKSSIRQVKQQIVQGRKWIIDNDNNDDDRRIFPGMIIDPDTTNLCFDEYPTIHAPYTVRSDYVDDIMDMYQHYLPPSQPSSHPHPSMTTTTTTVIQKQKTNNNNSDTTSSSSSPLSLLPPNTIRPIDVAHFWSIRENENNSANLRNAVTKTLLELKAKNETITRRTTPAAVGNNNRTTIQVIADHVSIAAGAGRTSVQKAYLEGLMTTKIVIVAQRDKWEDHYRLFESIIGGALVMTDPMLTLPEGYKNGTNIIIYQNLNELRQLILYYLQNDSERIQIATNGWKLAMGYHRTYHWMERLFFGKALTNVTTVTL